MSFPINEFKVLNGEKQVITGTALGVDGNLYRTGTTIDLPEEGTLQFGAFRIKDAQVSVVFIYY